MIDNTVAVLSESSMADFFHECMKVGTLTNGR